MMRLPDYLPTAALGMVVDPITTERSEPRLSTTEEQRHEAVSAALQQMADALVWAAEMRVDYTRQASTVMTVRGHAEHLAGAVIPCADAIEERTLDGRLIATTSAERFAQLERELAEDALPNGGLT